MPFGCFGGGSADAQSTQEQLRWELEQARTELAASKRELNNSTKLHEETISQLKVVAETDRRRRQEDITKLTARLEAKEAEAAEACDKLTKAQLEVTELKHSVEEMTQSMQQLQASEAVASSKVVECENELLDSKARLESIIQQLAVVREQAAVAKMEVLAAREDAKHANDQLIKALSEQVKAIADAEARAATVAQEAAASTVAAAAEMAEKAAVANRQQLEAIKADLAATRVKLEAAEIEAHETVLLRQQLHDIQQHNLSSMAELTTANEQRSDLSEQAAEVRTELNDIKLAHEGLQADRQMLAEQLEQVEAERTRLETQVQELEAKLLAAVTTGATPRSSLSGSRADAETALAAQLTAAQEEASEARRQLERTVVEHADMDEAAYTENKKLKCLVEELRAGLLSAQARVTELEITQSLTAKMGSQLDDAQYALEEARSSAETLRQAVLDLRQERDSLRSREEEARAEVEKLKQQLREAQMRSVELVTATADCQLELAKLRSEVASQGMLSDSNAQMTAHLLSDYQTLKDEHNRLRGELRSKDEMMALLRDQLSSLTAIDVDAMLSKLDNVQTRKKAMPSSLEAMMAAAGLPIKSGTPKAHANGDSGGGASSGASVAATPASVSDSSDGGASETARDI